MINEVEFRGEWYLPEKPEVKYKGVLYFNPKEGARLILDASYFNDLERLINYNSLLGKVERNELCINNKVSLFNLVFIRNKGSEFPQIQFNVQNFITNVHITSTEEACFDEVLLSFHNLYEWLDKSSVNMQYLDNSYNDFVFTYDGVIKDEFKINDELAAELLIVPTYSRPYQNQFSFQEQAIWILKYLEPRSLKNILNDATVLIHFIKFISYEQSYPVFIKLKQGEIYCNYYAKVSYYNDQLTPKGVSEFVLNYDEVNASLGKIINKWFEISNGKFKHSISLLVEYLNDKKNISIDKFLILVKAIEVFDRSKNLNEHSINPDLFEDIKKEIFNLDIIKNLSCNDRGGIEGRFKHNEPSLNKRFKRLFELPIYQKLKDYLDNYHNNIWRKHKDFCFKVSNTRNYYTHYSVESEGSTFELIDLFYVNSILTYILYVEIMQQLEIDESLYLDKLNILILRA